MKRIPREIYHDIGPIHKITYYKNDAILESDKKNYIYHNNDLYEIEEVCNHKVLCLKDLYQKTIETVIYSDIQINNIYQRLVHDSDILLSFFFKRQDQIEEQLYPNYNDYYLLLNISKIYHMISIGRYFLEEWIKTQEGKYQNVFWIENDTINPFLYYKVNINKEVVKDNLLFSLANYYQSFYYEKDITKELEELFLDFSMNDYEKYLFYSLISLPINKDNNQEKVKELVEYTNKTLSYLSEKYKENQETKETMLKKQQEDIELGSNKE